MRASEFLIEYDLKVSRDADGVAIKATAGGKQLGHAEFFFDEQGRLDPQTVWVDERFHGQGIAADMYDHLKSLGYTIIRSWDQTDAGRGFWNKHRGPEATVWESQRRLPRAIEEFLDSLNPDDCGVEDIGAYRIHFEGFTSDCKSSADYRRNPEAVYQQVYADFVRREGGQRPLIQDMVGDERFPILYSIFRRKRAVSESQQATARQVLNYINKTHHEPFKPGEKMYAAVMAHPQWQLKRVPLLNLNIPDQEYDDVDYDEYEPESDPYGRVMTVEPGHAGEVSQHLVDQNPIVIDADRYIIDGNHRAWAAKYLLNRDYIDAWVPVKQIEEITRRDFLRGAGAMAGTAAMGQPVQAQTQEDVEDILTSAANLYAILVKHFRQDPRTKALGAIFKSMSFSLKYREKFREEYEQATLGLDLLQKKPNEYKEYVQKFLSNYEKIKRDLESLQDLLTEVNYPDELTVSDQIQEYFFKRGYSLAGEGRDQMAFESPRGTILKVLGIGEDEREQVVKRYVRFFEKNQRNPFYPRIYNSGDFEVDGETYFVYEMERVNYVANEEATLDYIEKLMAAVDRGQGAEYVKKNPVPDEIGKKQLAGLLQATEHMMRALGGTAPLDLTAVENLGRRDNGHLVIVDPYSL